MGIRLHYAYGEPKERIIVSVSYFGYLIRVSNEIDVTCLLFPTGQDYTNTHEIVTFIQKAEKFLEDLQPVNISVPNRGKDDATVELAYNVNTLKMRFSLEVRMEGRTSGGNRKATAVLNVTEFQQILESTVEYFKLKGS